MEREPSTGVRINPDDLGRAIGACEEASNDVRQILHFLRLHGKSPQEWGGDAVSHDVASHYTQQLWAGAYCTYSALNNYNEELLSTLAALRQTLADYNKFDTIAAESLEQL
jgi:hypothetical protein